MDIAAVEKAKREFEALLAAVWAKQVERLRLRPDTGGTAANGGESVEGPSGSPGQRQEATGMASQERLIRYVGRSGGGRNVRD